MKGVLALIIGVGLILMATVASAQLSPTMTLTKDQCTNLVKSCPPVVGPTGPRGPAGPAGAVGPAGPAGPAEGVGMYWVWEETPLQKVDTATSSYIAASVRDFRSAQLLCQGADRELLAIQFVKRGDQIIANKFPFVSSCSTNSGCGLNALFGANLELFQAGDALLTGKFCLSTVGIRNEATNIILRQ